MRPQSELWAERVPILIVMAATADAEVIAEGRGWSRSCPPKIDEPVAFGAAEGARGGPVAVFRPASVQGGVTAAVEPSAADR